MELSDHSKSALRMLSELETLNICKVDIASSSCRHSITLIAERIKRTSEKYGKLCVAIVPEMRFSVYAIGCNVVGVDCYIFTRDYFRYKAAEYRNTSLPLDTCVERPTVLVTSPDMVNKLAMELLARSSNQLILNMYIIDSFVKSNGKMVFSMNIPAYFYTTIVNSHLDNSNIVAWRRSMATLYLEDGYCLIPTNYGVVFRKFSTAASRFHVLTRYHTVQQPAYNALCVAFQEFSTRFGISGKSCKHLYEKIFLRGTCVVCLDDDAEFLSKCCLTRIHASCLLLWEKLCGTRHDNQGSGYYLSMARCASCQHMRPLYVDTEEDVRLLLCEVNAVVDPLELTAAICDFTTSSKHVAQLMFTRLVHRYKESHVFVEMADAMYSESILFCTKLVVVTDSSRRAESIIARCGGDSRMCAFTVDVIVLDRRYTL